MMDTRSDGIAPNSSRLLWAGFMAILASSLGFGVRGGILDAWRLDFGFTGQQLGAIAGSGLTGFCFGIIIGGVVCDRVGYGRLIIAAFLTHLLSAVITLYPSAGMDADLAYDFLFWGAFVFAFANGTLEAVANPLVATLFPNKRTHYLNILHASWPAGLILGGAIGWILGGAWGWHWKSQFALFLVPTLAYGIMFFKQDMPMSKASQHGLSTGEMFKDVGILGGTVVCFLLALFFSQALGLSSAFAYGVSGVLLLTIGVMTRFSIGSLLLFLLFVGHLLVGAVELGTDTWVQNITGNILTPAQGKILFIFTSTIMFLLRFCAHSIEKHLRLSPVGILLVCSILAALGLNLVSSAATFVGALAALTIYAVGKTFFWPTMLAVASDRFPRTGAIAISIMGGIGMLSGGLLGANGLGYAKDRFTAEALQQTDAAIYVEYQAERTSAFMAFEEVRGLDGKKVGAIHEKLNAARADAPDDPAAALDVLTTAELAVHEAGIRGDRRTLVADSVIPISMAAIFLLLLIYFRIIGGYRPLTLEGNPDLDDNHG